MSFSKSIADIQSVPMERQYIVAITNSEIHGNMSIKTHLKSYDDQTYGGYKTYGDVNNKLCVHSSYDMEDIYISGGSRLNILTSQWLAFCVLQVR